VSNGSGSVAGLRVLKALVWIVYALATAAIIVMAFAFFLRIFDASTAAPFTRFIYDWAATFAAPFAGMIEPTQLSNGGSVSWSALFAIAAYAVVAAIVGSILTSISRRIYHDTRPEPMGQKTVVTTQETPSGGTVATKTTVPIAEPSAEDLPGPAGEPAPGPDASKG